MAVTDDPRWRRASAWLSSDAPLGVPELGLLGVPAHRSSLSPTRADLTPAAVRAALARFSTGFAESQDLTRGCRVSDLGDVTDPDGPAGEAATSELVRDWLAGTPGEGRRLLLAIGGDNSITYSVAGGARATGLVTLDAHHDLRDGTSNGSPVRRLVETGIPGRRIVQVGIMDFANSPQYAARANALQITVVRRDELESRPITEVVRAAIDHAARDGGRVHVDLDVDVCDRAVAPACPASVPGGISALQLRQAARAAAAHPQVVSMDITEVDSSADTPDGRTVRLAALCVLEVAAGLCQAGAVGRAPRPSVAPG